MRYMNKNDSQIAQLFHGQTRTYLICGSEECGKVRNA